LAGFLRLDGVSGSFREFPAQGLLYFEFSSNLLTVILSVSKMVYNDTSDKVMHYSGEKIPAFGRRDFFYRTLLQKTGTTDHATSSCLKQKPF
jgi:hypothetical protein